MRASASLETLLRSLGVVIEPSAGVDASHSGSQVWLAERGGEPVVVKATVASSGLHRRRAERELQFYREPVGGIRVPHLIDSVTTSEVIVLLLERCQPAGSAETWEEDRWLALVDLLVVLHSSAISSQELWRRPPAEVLAVDDPAVLSFFADPHDRELLQRVTSDGRLNDNDPLDEVFVHSDCHVDNVLLDDTGELVLTDWQECGFGDPAGDLAFALVRAWPTGARPPVEAMVTRYAQRRGLDRHAVARAVAGHELRAIALQFPSYAAFLSDESAERLRVRFRELADGDWAVEQ